MEIKSNVLYDRITGGLPSDVSFVKTARGGIIDVDKKTGIVEAFTAAIGNKDSVNDIIQPGAFLNSLKKRKPRVVWGHDWNKPIGKVLEIEEVGPNDPRLPPKMRAAGVGGLYTKVQFNLRSERGRQAFEDVDFFGEEQEWSIGYKTITQAYDPHNKANLLQEVELYEVSPVLHGANQLTATISVKDDPNKYSFEEISQPQDAGVVDFDDLEEKVGRVVAGRNMARLRQVVEIIQAIIDEGGVDIERKLGEKSAYAEDFKVKSAEDFEIGEVLIYGDTESVAGVTVDVKTTNRDQTAEILNAANDLVCCKGFLVQVPPSADGGLVKFYLPGASDRKDALTELIAAIQGLSFDPEASVAKVGNHEPTDSILVSELFTEPESIG